MRCVSVHGYQLPVAIFPTSNAGAGKNNIKLPLCASIYFKMYSYSQVGQFPIPALELQLRIHKRYVTGISSENLNLSFP